jgi:hypothetical protein
MTEQSKIDKCIELIDDSRQSYVSWIEYFKSNPTEEHKEMFYIGDRKFHQECVDKYDFVINFLNGLKCNTEHVNVANVNDGTQAK